MVLQTWGKWSGSFFFRPHVTTLLYLARMVVSCPWHVRFWRIHCKFQHRAGQNCLAAGFFFTCWVLMKFSNLGRYSEAQEWHRMRKTRWKWSHRFKPMKVLTQLLPHLHAHSQGFHVHHVLRKGSASSSQLHVRLANVSDMVTSELKTEPKPFSGLIYLWYSIL